MQLNKLQIDLVSKYMADISKILFASTIVGFFVPSSISSVTLSVFLFGSMATGFALCASIRLMKQ